MKINDIKKIVVSATREELNDYLTNPPYWDRHGLSSSTPDINDILEDIFCRKGVMKIVTKEYPQSHFDDQIDRRYRYSASRCGGGDWEWRVTTVINSGTGSLSYTSVNDGKFNVEFVLTDSKENSGVSILEI